MTLENLISSKEILYIYNLYPVYLYDYYIIIYTNELDLNNLLIDINFYAIPVDKWLDMSIHNDMLVWKCSCLSKKYVLKEYVKMLCKCIPLELRKYIDKKLNLELLKSNLGDSYLLLKDINYATQIIEYHKIKNYSVCNDYYELCKKCKTKQEEMNLFNKYKSVSYNILKQYTDEVLLKEKIAKLSIKQNG